MTALSSRLAARRQGWRGKGAVCGGRRERRLRCDARPAVGAPNSLCSLRSRRSDNRAQHDDERAARDDRWPALLAAPECALTAPPLTPGFALELTTPVCKGAARWAAARLWGAGDAQGWRPRAQRDATSDSSRLSERRERSERSEFRDAGRRPWALPGSRCCAPTAAVKRCGPSRCAFADVM